MNKLFLIKEMPHYTDSDAYVSDLALSSIWGDSPEDEIPAERIAALRQLWDDAHTTIKSLASTYGLSNRKLAERFGIPYRTVEDWSRGIAKAPTYVLIMMAETLRSEKQQPPVYKFEDIMYANGRCVVVRRHGGLHVERLIITGWELCSIYDADELDEAIIDADFFA